MKAIHALLAAVIVCDAEGWQSAYDVAGLVPVVAQEIAP